MRSILAVIPRHRELETFSYSVSHDLRAPLRHISGFTKLLDEGLDGALDPTNRGYLRSVQSAASRMSRLIDALLRLAKFTHGDLKREPVDLSRIARQIAIELQNDLPARLTHFEIEDGVRVEGDADLLRVVLVNLLGNAWKFSSKKENGLIQFGSLRQADGSNAYFVRDEGAGFDMNYADKLFGPFQRLHSENEFDGVGIGLATVDRIIHRHGGRIWAQSTLGGGATFTFTLSGPAHQKQV